MYQQLIKCVNYIILLIFVKFEKKNLLIIQTVVKLYFINKKKSLNIFKFLIENLGIINFLLKKKNSIKTNFVSCTCTSKNYPNERKDFKS